jgi:hypothetical protein
MKYEGTRHMREIVVNDNNRSPDVPSMCTWGIFIEVVTHDHYNVLNAPFSYPNMSLHSQWVITVICDL